VLVAGFVAGGSEDIDANQETVRLLRSQLRTKSALKVIDADILPLIEVAQDQAKATAEDLARENSSPTTRAAARIRSPSMALPQKIKDEKDLGAVRAVVREHRLLETHRRRIPEPAHRHRHGALHQPVDLGLRAARPGNLRPYGRRRVVPTRTYMERKGFMLRPKFVFIDGRSGATMYSESYREEVLYNAQQNTPALSSYFELMDRLVPSFLSALSSQKIKGSASAE
jgi:hypothetical protein